MCAGTDRERDKHCRARLQGGHRRWKRPGRASDVTKRKGLSVGQDLTFSRTLLHSQSSLVPIVTNFNSIKEGLCLRWRDNGTFCVTSQLEDLQSVLGSDLTLSALTNFNAADLESYPREQACDDCSHALTTKFQPLIANNNSLFSGIGQTIQNYCGDAFLDGQIPSTVLAQNDSSSSNGTAGGEEAAATPASSATMAKSVGFGTAAVALLAAVALV